MSLGCLCAGTVMAALAPGAGLRAAQFELWGGAFLVSGLALIGAGLPLFR